MIVINVHGGLVQDVFCTRPEDYVLVDWDNTEEADGEDHFEVDGDVAFVAVCACHSMTDLAGTECGMAVADKLRLEPVPMRQVMVNHYRCAHGGKHKNPDGKLAKPYEWWENKPSKSDQGTCPLCRRAKSPDSSARHAVPTEGAAAPVQPNAELVHALEEAAKLLRPLVLKLNIRKHFREHNVLANTIEKTLRKYTANDNT